MQIHLLYDIISRAVARADKERMQHPFSWACSSRKILLSFNFNHESILITGITLWEKEEMAASCTSAWLRPWSEGKEHTK